MSAKIIRDPLYNYIGIDRKRDGWLLDVLNSPEIQRLRRIHQLGVSYLTYPGADHSRLVHSLGVLHLMTQMMEHLESNYEDAQVRRAREPLLAAALVHDVGHGPFSHLFEPCLGINHEDWSVKIIECLDTTCTRPFVLVIRHSPVLWPNWSIPGIAVIPVAEVSPVEPTGHGPPRLLAAR